jgi:hypothetical protein
MVKPGKNVHFSTYPPPTLIHLSHHFTSASKPAAQKSFDCSQPLPHLHFDLFIISETFATKVFLVNQTNGSHQGPSPGCKVHVQEVPTVVLEISPGLLGLYGVWHRHDEAVPLLTAGLDVFCELHPEASTELHSTCLVQ